MTDPPQSTIYDLQSAIPRIGAIILAGGESRRMGRDKAELRLPPPDGPRVISYVINALAQVVPKQEMIIVGTGREMLGLTTVYDVLAGQGPLVGLYSGLRETQRDWNLVVACDLPLLQPALLRGLLSLLGEEGAQGEQGFAPADEESALPAAPQYDAIVPLLGLPQTTCALYHRRIMPTIERLLAEDVRSLRELLAAIETRYVSEAELRRWDGELLSFVNLNTEQDYARVAALLRQRLQREGDA